MTRHLFITTISQLSLSIPGSSFVLKGQHLLARLRIDDNDKENGFCL